MKILIKNGRILNPASQTDDINDLLIEADKIIKIEKNININADKIINANECFVMPGFIDMHVHLREPGFEYKETIKTGSMAGIRGGFTTICAMPNTNPVTDSKETAEWVINKAKKEAKLNIIVVGAVTKGQRGEERTDIKAMKEVGVTAISEDGKSVMNTAIYKAAMEEAKLEDVIVLAHCEDKHLVGEGVLNAGKKAKEMGFVGIDNVVEDSIAARDILLSKATGARLHLCHCSTKDSVELIRIAKSAGLPVSGEVCPHHFTLTEEDIKEDDGNYKMNPPLRTGEDVDALILGLKDGIIEVIATDHAPHHEDEKKESISKAPFGIVGLETAASLTYTQLVDKGILTPLDMAAKLSYNPAKILKIDKGILEVGKIADIVIFDPNVSYNIDKNTFCSKGKNTPFHGRKVKGKVKATIVSGEVVYEE